ncbi:MAG TPA: hypothetical protein VGV09_21045 [Steroidobacteraceae bacterium]|nr:hypothetical protein [Steroidobacteraceae bacterium]
MTIFKAFRRGSARAKATQQSTSGTTAKAAPTRGDYRAVSVAPGSPCCSAATTIAGTRYLPRDAPRLPLVACTMTPACSCKFKKVVDRRDGERRDTDAKANNSVVSGTKDRRRAGRRAAKA